MFDVDPGEEHIEIEATGVQFNWLLRYPGPDGALGTRDYKLITGTNPMGQDWTDPKNHDDFHPSEIVIPVGKKVRVRIIGRDVLHNFYLPHFRVKMDAVPGIPTYFVFTPTVTTEEYRQRLSEYPEYQVPADPSEPDGPQRWETFEYELACAELCGSGHFSMRRILKVVSEEEYQDWLAQQNSYYLSSIRNGDDDPLKGKLLDLEISARKAEFSTALNEILAKEEVSAEVIALKHLFFETASSVILDDSRYELENLATALKANPTITISIEGHTDNVGEAEMNLTLSKSRAEAVLAYLIEQGIDGSRLSSIGYGSSKPVAENDSDENRALNRRTEFRILSK
jgi:cytochrome c oxidase subunit 2